MLFRLSRWGAKLFKVYLQRLGIECHFVVASFLSDRQDLGTIREQFTSNIVRATDWSTVAVA